MKSEFKDKLLEIRKDLSFYRRDKKELKKLYIEERLSQSLKCYYKELNDSYTYLRYQDEKKVVKDL